jgi:hypothetical protein
MKTVMCDSCGQKTKHTQSIHVVEQGICGRTDPVLSTYVDLCPECLCQELKHILEHLILRENYKTWAMRLMQSVHAQREKANQNEATK